MNPVADGRATFRRIAAAPRQWLWFQVFCLSKAILPHEHNNDFRKLTTTMLFGVWVALTMGFGTVSSQHYTAITALVFMILGQQWELEKVRFGPFQFGEESDD